MQLLHPHLCLNDVASLEDTNGGVSWTSVTRPPDRAIGRPGRMATCCNKQGVSSTLKTKYFTSQVGKAKLCGQLVQQYNILLCKPANAWCIMVPSKRRNQRGAYSIFSAHLVRPVALSSSCFRFEICRLSLKSRCLIMGGAKRTKGDQLG